jgi:hypothetical protein
MTTDWNVNEMLRGRPGGIALRYPDGQFQFSPDEKRASTVDEAIQFFQEREERKRQAAGRPEEVHRKFGMPDSEETR